MADPSTDFSAGFSVGFAVGLTGGIGSGKSTVADMFAARGVAVVDTDQIAHGLTAPGGAAMAAVREAFGPEFVDADGAMDRARMREHVFADPEAKRRLEAILHPMIGAETARLARLAHLARLPGRAGQADGGPDGAAGTGGAHPYVMFVVPLLVESGVWRQRVARVCVVDCQEELQVRRVMDRNGMAERQVRAVMAAQATRERRLAAADDIIANDAGLAGLEAQVERLHRMYCEMATGK